MDLRFNLNNVDPTAGADDIALNTTPLGYYLPYKDTTVIVAATRSYTVKEDYTTVKANFGAKSIEVTNSTTGELFSIFITAITTIRRNSPGGTIIRLGEGFNKDFKVTEGYDSVANAIVQNVSVVAASDVSVTPTGNLSSTDVQSALEELQADIDGFSGGATNLTVTNITATTLDIDSSTGTDATIPAATVSDAGLLTATDKTKLDGIESGATADQDASEVAVTPTGNLGSTDVQAALEELQTDIDGFGGGGVSGSGTTNRIAKFTGATAIGDSLLSESGTRVAQGVSNVTSSITNAKNNGQSISAGLVATTRLIGAGSIRIDLPNSAILTTGSRNNYVSFDVLVAGADGSYLFRVYSRIRPGSSWSLNNACFLISQLPFNGNATFVHSVSTAGRHSVYLGEVTQTWSTTNVYDVSISNVSLSYDGLSVSTDVEDISHGWGIALESSAIGGTVRYQKPIPNQYSRIFYNRDNAFGVGFFFKHEIGSIFYGQTYSGFTGAHEITIPVSTAWSASGFSLSFRGYLNTGATNYQTHKHFRLSGSYNALGKTWSNTRVDWEGGTPADIPIRFGTDGTSPKIWIGELTTVWSDGTMGFYHPQTALLANSVHDALFFESVWTRTSVSSFGTVSSTVLASTDRAIATSDRNGSLFSNNMTSSVKLPAGTTAQRPGTPATGEIRYNSSLSAGEIYDGSNWVRTRPYSYTPSSSSDSAGNIGDVTYDSTYMYIKTGASAWGRITLTTAF